MREHIKTFEDGIVEEDIEEIMGMKDITEKKLGLGLEKDNFQRETVEEMTEV